MNFQKWKSDELRTYPEASICDCHVFDRPQTTGITWSLSESLGGMKFLPSRCTWPWVSSTWHQKFLGNEGLCVYHVPFEKKPCFSSHQNSVIRFLESRAWNPKPTQSYCFAFKINLLTGCVSDYTYRMYVNIIHEILCSIFHLKSWQCTKTETIQNSTPKSKIFRKWTSSTQM